MYECALKEKKKKAYYFQTKEELLENLEKILRRGDNILVKASHGMKFEQVVEFLKADDGNK